jgi:hypothetical protein
MTHQLQNFEFGIPGAARHEPARQPRQIRRLLWALLALSLVVTGIPSLGVAASAAGSSSASLEQCTNGPVGPPIAPGACVGSNAAAVSVAITGIHGGASTSYKNWVNGNSNGSKSHWREGDMISYRAVVSGVATGSPHTLVVSYDTVNSSHHAIDCLGSFDQTETTSPSTTGLSAAIIDANNNSPRAEPLVSLADQPTMPSGAGHRS